MRISRIRSLRDLVISEGLKELEISNFWLGYKIRIVNSEKNVVYDKDCEDVHSFLKKQEDNPKPYFQEG
jgi:hypothetical protein